MLLFHNPLHHQHQGRHEMYRGRLVPCHETAQRLDFVLAELARRPQGELRTPGPVDRALLARIHTPAYLDFLAGAWAEWVTLAPGNAELDILPSVWPGHGLRQGAPTRNFAARLGQHAFDAGSPMTAGTWDAALAGAACAIDAARALLAAPAPRATAALTRPPGHHAGADVMGGYCYLNNAALAAQALREGGVPRVAVLDIDYHHGNGTQAIFYGRGDVLTVSVHGDPATEYPFYLGYADEVGEGAGLGCNLNLPLPRGSDAATWFGALDQGLAAVAAFGAQALVVPLGVDTFEGDPISGFHLRSADYLAVGAAIARAGLPTVFVMEGGYAVAEVGVNLVNVLQGFRQAGAGADTV